MLDDVRKFCLSPVPILLLGGDSPRCFSCVSHFLREVSGDLQEVKLSRAHQELQKLAPLFVEVAEKRELRPEVLGAIALRESNAGLALKEGWGDGDNAYGIMQVDKRHHNVVEGSGPASKDCSGPPCIVSTFFF